MKLSRVITAIVSISLCCIPLCAQDFSQYGPDIKGETDGARTGESVAISGDGNVVAVGVGYGGVGVRAFEWNGTNWDQRGQVIEGRPGGDGFGAAVATSSDGNTIAIGAPFSSTPYVRVVEWNGVEWMQLGDDVLGGNGDNTGYSVAIDSEGSVIAVGAPNSDAGEERAGRVQVFEWDGSGWMQRGADIVGETPGDLLGDDVSLSNNGSTVAVSGSGQANSLRRGLVRVFGWDGRSWNQVGDDVYGEGEGDWFGYSVSLNHSGERFAVGAPFSVEDEFLHGKVYVYAFSSGNWVQQGATISGADYDDHQLGFDVAMSGVGTRIAASSIYNFADRRDRVRIFELNENSWAQKSSVEGNYDADHFGYSTTFGRSNPLEGQFEGQFLAIGSIYSDSREGTGYVKVFGIDSDADGVSNIVEDASPNSGDSNGDGVQDSQQSQVASLPLVTGDNTGEYVSIEVESAASLESASSIDLPDSDSLPASAEANYGSFSFALSGLSPGGTAQVEITLPEGASPDSYWKYGPTSEEVTPHWYDFAFDGVTGSIINSNVISLFLVDGQRGDSDLTANGEVVDPGAPATEAGQVSIDPPADAGLPSSATLLDNYPNPFNRSTQISYSLPATGFVRLAVYDLQGRSVKTLVSGQIETGTYVTLWDGTDSTGQSVASGVYLCRLDTDSASLTKRMILLR